MSDLQKLIQGKIKTVSRIYSVAILIIKIDSLSIKGSWPFITSEIAGVLNIFGPKFPKPFIMLTK